MILLQPYRYSNVAGVCSTIEADDQESESDGDMDEHELDDEGGDLDTEECDKLDEQMWGSDNEEPVTVRADYSYFCVFLICCCL